MQLPMDALVASAAPRYRAYRNVHILSLPRDALLEICNALLSSDARALTAAAMENFHKLLPFVSTCSYLRALYFHSIVSVNVPKHAPALAVVLRRACCTLRSAVLPSLTKTIRRLPALRSLTVSQLGPRAADAMLSISPGIRVLRIAHADTACATQLVRLVNVVQWPDLRVFDLTFGGRFVTESQHFGEKEEDGEEQQDEDEEHEMDIFAETDEEDEEEDEEESKRPEKLVTAYLYVYNTSSRCQAALEFQRQVFAQVCTAAFMQHEMVKSVSVTLEHDHKCTRNAKTVNAVKGKEEEEEEDDSRSKVQTEKADADKWSHLYIHALDSAERKAWHLLCTARIVVCASGLSQLERVIVPAFPPAPATRCGETPNGRGDSMRYRVLLGHNKELVQLHPGRAVIASTIGRVVTEASPESLRVLEIGDVRQALPFGGSSYEGSELNALKTELKNRLDSASVRALVVADPNYILGYPRCALVFDFHLSLVRTAAAASVHSLRSIHMHTSFLCVFFNDAKRDPQSLFTHFSHVENINVSHCPLHTVHGSSAAVTFLTMLPPFITALAAHVPKLASLSLDHVGNWIVQSASSDGDEVMADGTERVKRLIEQCLDAAYSYRVRHRSCDMTRVIGPLEQWLDSFDNGDGKVATVQS